jgi:hypothetical protein
MTTTMPPPPDWAILEDDQTYHARSKSGEYMSSGMLKKFRQCPYAYRQEVTGQIAAKDTDAFRFGRAVHKMLLEGEQAFSKSYAIGGPINPKTGKTYGVGTQKHDEWLAENGYTRDQLVSPDDAAALFAMRRMVDNHEIATAYLAFGWPELVVRADLHGVPCQIRMDWLTHDADGNHVIVDLKTAEEMTWFEKDSKRYEYPHQFALYRDVLRQATGIDAGFVVLAAEKKQPFRVGVWNISPEDLDYFSEMNRLALTNYAQCLAADVWPTGYEDPRTASFKFN